MKIRTFKSEKGMALLAVSIIVLIFTLLGLSVLGVANSEILQVRKEINKTKAFYLAEAGVARLTANLYNGNFANIGETALGCGSYRVDFNAVVGEPCAVATGEAGEETGRVQVTISFLIPPYENSIYAGGSGGAAWALRLRGTGDPCKIYGNYWNGSSWVYAQIGDVNGKDIVNGNIFVDGNVAMYEQSRVNPAPWPNTYNLRGDVNATGSVSLYGGATVAGQKFDHSAKMGLPDLVGMNYAINNTHNVAKVFADACVASGYLPSGNPLRNVFVKNPSDRSTECGATSGNDYFFEPSTGFVNGSPYTGDTPLHAGNDRVYYVDGDVWIHSKPTYGFKMDGKATIVATGNIHICDNLQYVDSQVDMLGLVALGKYDSSGQRVSGGNIYFGDPGYGNMSVFSGMMFAANDFAYNTDPLGSTLKEPDSGFTVTGNFAALNSISIERDWYTNAQSGKRRPARYDPHNDQWRDVVTNNPLNQAEINTMKHYRMMVNYDDRVRNVSTQPPGLPKGTGLIFCGLTKWKELP